MRRAPHRREGQRAATEHPRPPADLLPLEPCPVRRRRVQPEPARQPTHQRPASRQRDHRVLVAAANAMQARNTRVFFSVRFYFCIA